MISLEQHLFCKGPYLKTKIMKSAVLCSVNTAR